MHEASDLRDLITYEVDQLRESGHDVDRLAQESADAVVDDSPDADVRRRALLDRLQALTPRADWPYVEPSGWEEIDAVLPPRSLTEPPPAQDLHDRILGAWLGRCAGCNLGKPVEGWGWTRQRIREYTELADAFPLANYLPVLDPMPNGWVLNPVCWQDTTLGNVRGMARDDDTDYTILALHVLETYGFDFTAADVGAEWLDKLPFTQTYTAERVAYRNLINGVTPPRTASLDNPYREWIGAQIRADMFGYVSPGDPRSAAELAWRDASLSHTANGLYGSMWVAALLATALTTSDVRVALDASLEHVPPRSRLHEALTAVIGLRNKGVDWDTARDEVEAQLGHYSWIHTINNAAVVALALLWGEGDFSRTIGLAVEGGWDTDCNGATAGSVFGALHGVAAIPAHWTDPLEDRITSALAGYHESSISDLATRTTRLAQARIDNRPAPAGAAR